MRDINKQQKFDRNNADIVVETTDEEVLYQQAYESALPYVLQKMTDFEGSKVEKDEHNKILSSCVMGNKDAQLQVKAMIKKFITDAGIYHAKFIDRLTSDIYVNKYGLGAIEDLVNDSTVSEVLVNGAEHIWIERDGQLERLKERSYESDEEVRRIIGQILQFDKKEITRQKPYEESRMADGSRITVSIPPLAKRPYISIRKFDTITLETENLIKKGTLTEEIAVWLMNVVKARMNILIIGETGSGKTLFLKWLAGFINPKLRIGTIESTFELKLDEKYPDRDIFSFEEHPELGIYLVDIFKICLRMRPDIIIVGEGRSYEVLELIKCMRRAHPGSMGTIHSNSPYTCIEDIASMISEDGKVRDPQALRYMIANAIDLVIQINRDDNTGTRRITNIIEVVDTPKDWTYSFNKIFEFVENPANPKVGQFKKVGSISEQLKNKIGTRLPEKILNEM